MSRQMAGLVARGDPLQSEHHSPTTNSLRPQETWVPNLAQGLLNHCVRMSVKGSIFALAASLWALGSCGPGRFDPPDLTITGEEVSDEPLVLSTAAGGCGRCGPSQFCAYDGIDEWCAQPCHGRRDCSRGDICYHTDDPNLNLCGPASADTGGQSPRGSAPDRRDYGYDNRGGGAGVPWLEPGANKNPYDDNVSFAGFRGRDPYSAPYDRDRDFCSTCDGICAEDSEGLLCTGECSSHAECASPYRCLRTNQRGLSLCAM